MLLNLSGCGGEAVCWNRLAREGRRRCHLVPGWSRMWVKADLGSPFTAFISESITGPLMTAARLRAPAPWNLLHTKQ